MLPPSPGMTSADDWIEPDYYRRPRRLRRLRGWFGWAALAGAVVVAAVSLAPGQRTWLQAGPLTPAHAPFNDQCQRCHTEAFATWNRFWSGASHPATPDQACARCHDASIHHEQQTHQPACASCHREHRGQATLTAVASRHCTACHADLHRRDGHPSAAAHITAFAVDHPEFAAWRDPPSAEPGGLHFNHHVHLADSGVADAAGRVEVLTCASCHQPDTDRWHFQPVQYEAHCARCHPLAVQLVDVPGDPAARAAADRYRREPAPHRAPAEVRTALRTRLTELAQAVRALRSPPGTDPDRRLLPGTRPAAAAEVGEAAWVEHQLRQSERLLFSAGGCGTCHPLGSSSADLPEVAVPQPVRSGPPRAKFQHDAHRFLRCTECHPAPASRSQVDLLLPRVAVCQACHNPQVGVRSECVDCHRYHGRAHAVDWMGTMTLDEFRRGGRP